MPWNYRIIKYEHDMGYGLHELYYDKDGKANGRTDKPIISCDIDEGPEGIIASLKLALDGAENHPYIKDSEIIGYEDEVPDNKTDKSTG